MNKYNKVFKPKNKFFALFLVTMPFWFLLSLVFTYLNLNKFEWENEGILLAIFGFSTILTFFLLPAIPKEIRFENKIIVKRYLLKDLVIEYSQVIDLDSFNLVAQNGSINFASIKNSYKLTQIINQLIDGKQIKIKGNLRKKEGMDLMVSIYSLIPAVATYLLLQNFLNISALKMYIYLPAFIVWIFFYKLIHKTISKNRD